MLPRKNRISRKNFPSLKVKGFPNNQIRVLNLKNKFFTAVFYIKEKRGESVDVTHPPQECRASIVVSKKTAKHAVDRNLLRRRFYDLIAPYLKDSLVSITLVLYPKIESRNVKFLIIKEEIEKTFKQAKLI